MKHTHVRTVVFGALAFLLAVASLLFLWAGGPALDSATWPDAAVLDLRAPPATEPLPEHIRVVSYNIGYASGSLNNTGASIPTVTLMGHLNEIAYTVRQTHPDILLLQEVDFSADRTHRINQLRHLGRLLNFPYAAYATTWNKRYIPWPYWPPSRHFGRVVSGQVVLSRFPILTQEIETMAKPAENTFWYNHFYLDRVVQRLTIRVGNQDIALWHLHLEAFARETRAAQLGTIAEWIAHLPSTTPLIIGGDLNTSALKALTASTGLIMPATLAGHPTFPSWEPSRQIDHILHSAHFSATNGSVLQGTTSSDHLAIWADLSLAQ
jgi:endonuclease/exonuclease/phosphatase family metal-dependent hydrolase